MKITPGVTYVLTLGELDATRLRWAAGRLHYECAIAALREEVVVPRILIPAAAYELGWWNDLW